MVTLGLLCSLPGRRGRGADGKEWTRSLGDDLRSLRDGFRADRLVTLIEDHELAAYGVPELSEAVHAAGLLYTRFPIADGTVPRGGPPELAPLITELAGALEGGERLVIHCVAGLGRTGTVAGCLLRHLGLSPEAALARLSKVRGPRCPETAAQRWFVGAYGSEVL